jgi:ribosomal protein S18 acetylase RimI-like enzyme
MNYLLRPTTSSDTHFLWEMLSEAACRDDILSVKQDVHLAKYVKDWGAPDDHGIIAYEGKSGKQLGAAWSRLLNDDNPGYGYYDDFTPELAIAVLPECRDRGMGKSLLVELLNRLSPIYPALSLSVRSTNEPAVRLYRSLGFTVVHERVDGHRGMTWTMIRKL